MNESELLPQSDTWPDGEGPVRLAPEVPDTETLIVDVAGFEGPLDLLLQLARSQKVDLARISILALADQYIAYIESARKMRLELAADYLVMAAWLAYLKSRLLIPKAPGEQAEPDGDDMALRLAFRLQRLQAMRDAAARLISGDRLGRDVFARGAPEPLVVETTREYSDNLIDLLKAYTERRQKKMRRGTYTVKRQPTWSIKEAREMLQKLVGQMNDWDSFDHWLARYLTDSALRPSIMASSFTASLELAREGVIEIRQEEAYQPIFMRRRAKAA